MSDQNSRMTPTVEAIGQMSFEGNIIPQSWYKSITYANGKPDVNAILILAEIVYWYRPTIQRNEETGQITSIHKKFKADMLQRSYASFSNQFGLSKRQCQDAVAHLVKRNLIKKDLRTIDTPQGKLANVLFVEPIPETIQRYTYHVVTYDPSRLNVTPNTSDRETNTGITTKTTTKTKKSGVSVSDHEIVEPTPAPPVKPLPVEEKVSPTVPTDQPSPSKVAPKVSPSPAVNGFGTRLDDKRIVSDDTPVKPPDADPHASRKRGTEFDPRLVGSDGLIPPGKGRTLWEIWRESFVWDVTAAQRRWMNENVTDLARWREITAECAVRGFKTFDNVRKVYLNGFEERNYNGHGKPTSRPGSDAGRGTSGTDGSTGSPTGKRKSTGADDPEFLERIAKRKAITAAAVSKVP